ncbi:MAG TPA: hypothetical protein VGU45_10595 [Microvirga sp.]|jgi:hypothetical protein|nr:hypothetical protein [Microvirga sp.]
MDLDVADTFSLDPLSTRPLHIGMRRQDLDEVYGSRMRRLKGLRGQVVMAVDRDVAGTGASPERLVLTLRRGRLSAWYRVKGVRAASDL